MNILKLTFLLFICPCFVQAQIINSGFETPQDTVLSLPGNWKVKNVEGFISYLDNEIKYSGQQSLNIKSTQEVNSNYISFSQTVNFDVNSLKRISISAYMKSKDVKGNAGLWCQVLDKDSRMIGFSNSEQKGIELDGNNEWKKYSLDFIVNNKTKKLLLGGYLSGAGSVWFDDFSIDVFDNSITPPSDEVTDYINEFKNIIVDNAIYNGSLNWNSINADIEILSKGMKTTADAYVISSYVLDKLREAGDNHSMFISKLLNDKESSENVDGRQPYSRLLENNIGYIYVPGFLHFTLDTISYNFADKIQSLIRELDSKNSVNGWIVDLRENTGGNMWPMITGLGPLTGEGTLGHFIIHKNNEIKPWNYKDGGSYESDSVSIKIRKPYTLKNPDTKIAVLIGSNTGSSGEMTTIAFIGKPNVKLFGNESAGFTTVNNVIILSDGSGIALATGFVSDRNNKIYRGTISPDVSVVDTAVNNIILTAQKWLNEK